MQVFHIKKAAIWRVLGMSSELTGVIVGSILAIIGGIIGNSFTSWRERKREEKSIKVCIGDELGEIKEVIDRMNEVWNTAHILSPSHIQDILDSTGNYEKLRVRLFLIKNEDTRKEINLFYKKLKAACRDKKNEVGSLNDDDESRKTQGEINTSFQQLGNEAKTLQDKLR